MSRHSNDSTRPGAIRQAGPAPLPSKAGLVQDLKLGLWPATARTPLDEATDLTAADVIHKRFSALPADATVAQVSDWFAASSQRGMAFLADHGVIGVTDDLADFCGTH